MINAETESRGDAEKIENLLLEQVLDAAIEVHRTLGGPGLLESLYEDALSSVGAAIYGEYILPGLKGLQVTAQVAASVSERRPGCR